MLETGMRKEGGFRLRSKARFSNHKFTVPHGERVWGQISHFGGGERQSRHAFNARDRGVSWSRA